jgi:hypothetical protein
MSSLFVVDRPRHLFTLTGLSDRVDVSRVRPIAVCESRGSQNDLHHAEDRHEKYVFHRRPQIA